MRYKFTVLGEDDTGVRIKDDRTGRVTFLPLAWLDAVTERWIQDGEPDPAEDAAYEQLVLSYVPLLPEPKRMAGLRFGDRRWYAVAAILAMLNKHKA